MPFLGAWKNNATIPGSKFKAGCFALIFLQIVDESTKWQYWLANIFVDIHGFTIYRLRFMGSALIVFKPGTVNPWTVNGYKMTYHFFPLCLQALFTQPSIEKSSK